MLHRIAALPTIAPRAQANNLGYRGFILRYTMEGENALARIQKGVVQRSIGQAIEYFSDPGRELERYLLSSGRSVVSPGIYAVIASELSA